MKLNLPKFNLIFYLSIRTILLKLKLFQFLRILQFFYHEIKLTKLASALNSTGLAGGSNTVEFKSSTKRVLSKGVSERGAQRQSIGWPVWTAMRYSCRDMPVWHF